ncbi:MAG: hypothetical protein IAE90_04720 [Ignavibacteria bacterium]|nr:hypothetical protein [Ignavibacteria bacterium]
MLTKITSRFLSLCFVLFAIILFSSCNKTADGNLTREQYDEGDKNLEAVAVDENDISESDEDLTSVNYMEFYEQLAPYGEWIQVKPEDIGMKPQSVQRNMNGSPGKIDSGLRHALASSYESNGMVYVWKPSTSLAVNSIEGAEPVYVPYRNGKWVNTNSGWYFKANTPAEETTSHYGRWVNNPEAGWLWVPGRVWAPAWVDWKQNDEYVSWAPLPPSVYLVKDEMSPSVIDNNNYTIVEKRYFVEPDVYKYNNNYYLNGERIIVNDFSSLVGLVLVEGKLINKGPDIGVIRSIYGKEIPLINIQNVRNFNEVKYTGNDYFVYKPGFQRFKSKDRKKFNVNQPKSFKKYGEWNVKSPDTKSEKEYQKQLKKDEKNSKNDNEFRKEIRKGDDGNMYDKRNGKDDNGKKDDRKNKKGNDGNKNNGSKENGNNKNK